MLVYKAMYRYLDAGVHAEVLDFPGVISCGEDLEQARRLLASALVDMAQVSLERGESLPFADPTVLTPLSPIPIPIWKRRSKLR